MSSNRVKTEYLPTRKECHYIKVELYYDLGGMNYFTYKQEPRGYYVSVCPVERRVLTDSTGRVYGTSEGFTAFSGTKMLLEPCQRKGKGAKQRALANYEQARAILLEKYTDQLLPEEASA